MEFDLLSFRSWGGDGRSAKPCYLMRHALTDNCHSLAGSDFYDGVQACASRQKALLEAGEARATKGGGPSQRP